jgi:hypothetical protein
MRREEVFWVGGFVAGFLIGLALGLIYTWVIDPPPLTVTSPAALNPHDKEIYTVLIAAAYVADEDLDRARSRLAQLKDPDTERTIIALAERYINEGRDARDIRALARLSDALGGTSAAMRPFIATSTSTPTLTPQPSVTRPLMDCFGSTYATARAKACRGFKSWSIGRAARIDSSPDLSRRPIWVTPILRWSQTRSTRWNWWMLKATRCKTSAPACPICVLICQPTSNRLGRLFFKSTDDANLLIFLGRYHTS